MSLKLSGFKNYFTFSRGERNGILILIFIIVILLFAPLIYKSLIRPIPSKDPEFYTRIDSFFNALQKTPDEVLKITANPIEAEEIVNTQPHQPFFFDPNKVSINDLVELGLSLKQANVIANYRSKGGHFHSPDEFSKIYVIDSITFNRLKPWIKIDQIAKEDNPGFKKDTINESKITINIIELNSTDTLELIKVKGIGRTYARRIVAYRALLGGYIDINQLKEVYGIKPELITSIASRVTVDKNRINQLNLNLVTYEDLKKHPYISDYQAKAIIYYRNKVNNINEVKELVDNRILPKEVFQKVKEYLVTH